MFDELKYTTKKDIHVGIQGDCEIIVETKIVPNKDHPIDFGVGIQGNFLVTYSYSSNETLYIDATRDINGKKFLEQPQYFIIKLPYGCRLHVFTEGRGR